MHHRKAIRLGFRVARGSTPVRLKNKNTAAFTAARRKIREDFTYDGQQKTPLLFGERIIIKENIACVDHKTHGFLLNFIK